MSACFSACVDKQGRNNNVIPQTRNWHTLQVNYPGKFTSNVNWVFFLKKINKFVKLIELTNKLTTDQYSQELGL